MFNQMDRYRNENDRIIWISLKKVQTSQHFNNKSMRWTEKKWSEKNLRLNDPMMWFTHAWNTLLFSSPSVYILLKYFPIKLWYFLSLSLYKILNWNASMFSRHVFFFSSWEGNRWLFSLLLWVDVWVCLCVSVCMCEWVNVHVDDSIHDLIVSFSLSFVNSIKKSNHFLFENKMEMCVCFFLYQFYSCNEWKFIICCCFFPLNGCSS